jgi:hypothetical protein
MASLTQVIASCWISVGISGWVAAEQSDAEANMRTVETARWVEAMDGVCRQEILTVYPQGIARDPQTRFSTLRI